MGDHVPDLAELVLDEHRFLTEHHARGPYLARGALTSRAHQFLSLADLDEVLRQRSTRSPYVRAAQDGASVREAEFLQDLDVSNEQVTDAVDPAAVERLLRRGATVTWNSLNHLLPNLRRTCEGLAARFASECDAIAFLTPPGREGYAVHHDPVDVFVVQLAGTKAWRVWPTPAERRPEAGHYVASDLGDPWCETTLRPGDVLYMPFGTPHVATAEDTLSLHLSITVRPHTLADVLERELRHLLTAVPGVHRQLGPGAGSDGAHVAALEVLRDELATALGALDVSRVLAEATAPQDPPVERSVLAAMGAVEALGADDLVRSGDDVALSFRDPVDGRTPVVVRPRDTRRRSGEQVGSAAESVVTLPSTLADALCDLQHSGRPRPVRQVMAGLPADAALVAARKLARAGVLSPVGGDAP